MGIKEDIGLINDDYQWLGSMFYFGMPAVPHCFPGPYLVTTLQGTSPGSTLQIDSSSASLSPNTPPSAS